MLSIANEQISAEPGEVGCPLRIAAGHLFFCSHAGAGGNISLHAVRTPAGPGATRIDYGAMATDGLYAGPWIGEDAAFWGVFKPTGYDIWTASIAAEKAGATIKYWWPGGSRTFP